MKHTNKKIATAKGIFKEMRVHNMIIQEDGKNWRLNLEQDQV
jgi:hypothetical protein